MRTLFLVALVTTILVVSFVTIGAAQNVKDLVKDLVLYYAFDEGEGNTLKDLSGNGNDGEIFGAEWVAGKFGKSLEFNGEDTYVDCGDSSSLQIKKEITLAAWVNVLGPATCAKISDVRMITREISGVAAPWASYCLNANAAGTGLFGFEISADTPDVYPKSATSPKVGVWYHVAGVYDGSKCDIYVNGEIEGTLEQSGNLVINPDFNTIIGADIYRVPITECFYGIIDEAVIYKRALSSKEISLLMEDSVKRVASVEPEGKLAIIWSRIKKKY